MTAHRFRVEIGGQVVLGLAFGSEEELEDFLLGHRILTEPATPEVVAAVRARARKTRGRPRAPAITQAISALGHLLDSCASGRAAARRVQERIANDGREPVPSIRTIERALRGRRQKWGQKSKRGISRSGGSHVGTAGEVAEAQRQRR